MSNCKKTQDLLEHHLVLPLYGPNGLLIAIIVENSMYDGGGNLILQGIPEGLIDALIEVYPTEDEEDEEGEETEELESDDDSILGPREFVDYDDEMGEQEAPGI